MRTQLEIVQHKLSWPWRWPEFSVEFYPRNKCRMANGAPNSKLVANKFGCKFIGRIGRTSHTWGSTGKVSEVWGLDPNLSVGTHANMHFELRRDAGTMTFTGDFDKGVGSGKNFFCAERGISSQE